MLVALLKFHLQMTAKRDKKMNSSNFGNIKEMKNEKSEMRNISKFDMEKTEECVRDSNDAKTDSRCKSWRLIVRNLPFKVDVLSLGFISAKLI